MTVQTALVQGQRLLEQAGIASPRLTAEVLLAHAVGHSRAWLFAHSSDELTELWWIHYGRYLHQRLSGIPTQYITGRQEFYGRDFRVTPDVLIPRPETEHLIQAALEKWRPATRAIDIGTGSGAIAVTLSLERSARLAATDLSVAALRIAAENARRLGARVDFAACDLAAAFADQSFDLVLSNPPYVPAGDVLPREVREHEPPLALYAGPAGLDVFGRLIPEANRILKPGGWLILEIGALQAEAVRALLGGWLDLEIRSDLAGLPRLALARSRRAD